MDDNNQRRLAELEIQNAQLQREIADLRRSQRLLQAVVEGTSDAIFVKDLQGRYLMANSAALNFAGKSIEEVLGHDDTLFFSAESAQQIMKRDRRIMESGQTTTDEEVGTISGLTRTYLSTKGPYRDDQGRVIGLIGISRDVTERKQLEEKLAERERRLRTILDSEPECVKTLAADGTVLEMNRAGLAMIEADSPDQILGQCVYSVVAPKDQPAFRHLVERVFQGYSETLEFEVIGLKGRRRWLETQGTPLRDESGQIISLLSVTRDITERKQAAEDRAHLAIRNEALVKAFAEIVYEWCPSEDKVVWDGEFTEVLGYTSEEIGSNTDCWTSRVHPDDLSRIQNEVEQATHERRLFELEYRFQRKDGSYVWMLDRGVTFVDERGVLTRIIGMFRDITDRKRVEESLSNTLEFNRQIIECATEGFVVYDRELRYVVWNPSMERLSGVSAAEVLGRRSEVVFPFLREAGVTANLERALAGATVVTPDMPFTVPQSGRSGWSSAHHAPLRSAAGEMIGVISTVRDITERKRTEEALRESERHHRELMEGLPVTVYLTDAEGTLTMVNEAAVTFWGRRPILGEEKWCGSLKLYTADGKFLPHAECPMAVALRQGRAILGMEAQSERPDGTRINFLANITPRFDRSGMVTGAMNVLVDITARKHAEEALRASEERFSKVFQNSPDSIALVSCPDGRLIDVNDQFIKSTGHSREDAIGHTSLELGLWDHPADRDWFVHMSSEPEGVRAFEASLLTKSGERRDMRFSSDMIDLGSHHCLIAVGRDVTLQKQMAEALRESNERFLLVAKATNDVVWDWNLATDVGWWNDGVYALFGFQREQVPVEAIEWNEHLHPADRDRVLQGVHAMIDGGGQSWSDEYRILRADGSEVVVFDRGFVLRDSNGKAYRMLGVTQDITERKQAEQSLRDSEARLAGLINSAMDAIITFDEEQQVVLFNPAAERIFQRTAGEVMGKSIQQFIPERFHATHVEQVRQFAISGTSVRRMGEQTQVVGLRPDGSEFPAEASILQLEVSGKRFLTVILRDITERKRASEELSASRERLELLSRQLIATQESERRHLARELHDEVGQTLTGIKLNLKALQQRKQAARSSPLMQDTIALVDQTLQQIRSLALDLRPSMLDDIGLVAALRWCLDRQARQVGFFAHFVSESSDAQVSPDIATACFRVAQESLTNIARHAHARNVHVEIRQNDDALELLVTDDGIGFDVAAARARANHGASIGLLGMAERVQIVGGQFEIKSNPSGGTTINARFPILKMTNVEWPNDESSSHAPHQSHPR